MKIDEPKTPYHTYESGKESDVEDADGAHRATKGVRRVSLSGVDAPRPVDLATAVADRIASGDGKPSALNDLNA